MSRNKLIGIIGACIVVVIVVIVIITRPPTALPTDTYTLSLGVSPSGAGSVSPSGGEYESGVQVTLTANPTGGYQFVNWSGDVGTIGNANAASTTIVMNGDYSVTANFGEDSISEPLEPPEAVASATPIEANTGESISFSGVDSTDPDGTIVSYEWDFGDGATASGITVSHAYSAVGSFDAELTVTDNDGLSDTDEVTVMVETAIVEASDGRITIILDRVTRGDVVPPDVAEGLSQSEELGAPTEGYEYVCVSLTISAIENVDVVNILGHGQEKASLHGTEGHEYECKAATCQGIEFSDPHHLTSAHRLVEGAVGSWVFEFPKYEEPVKLEVIYSFKEDWQDETEDAKRGQLDIMIPSTLISAPT